MRAQFGPYFILSSMALLCMAIGSGRTPALAQAPASARLAFLHVSADAPTLDIYVDGSRAITGLDFSSASQYLSLTPGSHRIQVTLSGHIEALADSSVQLGAGSSSTWVLSGIISDNDVAMPVTPEMRLRNIIQLNDVAGDSSDQRPRLRVLNASPGGGPLDVHLDGPGSVALTTALSYGGLSAYTSLPSANYSVTIYASGTAMVLAGLPLVTLQPQRAYTLVLGGLLPGVASPNPSVLIQGFVPVFLTDQSSLRSALLTRGCNQVILSLPVGAPVSSVLSRVDASGVVTSIWRFDNRLKRLVAGYFTDPGAPLEYSATVVSPEAEFICVSADTSWNPPA